MNWPIPPNHDVPTFRGVEARRELYRRYGLPCTAPLPGQSHFNGRCRILFWDDNQPACYWEPEPKGEG